MKRVSSMRKLIFKNFIRIALVILSVCCVAFCLPEAEAALSDRIRVGIFYGSNALPSANLQNETGSGYQFGYYDNSYNFIPVGKTSKERITMCKDANLYLSGGVFYEAATKASYRLIGAYHLQASGSYKSFEAAQEAAKNYPYGFPAYIKGKYVVRFEFYSTKGNAQADAEKYEDATVVGGSSTCYTVVNTATGDILFEFDNGTASCLAVQPDITGKKNPTTWFKGYRYYGAFQYNRRNGNDITVINVVNTDQYVAGVLPYEFVCSGKLESLKAGAVAIRTFACAATKHKSLGFDVCTTTDCQVYHGVYTGDESAKVTKAAEATSGECLYYNGEYAQTTFYAANGGATESSANTWSTAYPYLIAQKDPYEQTIMFNSHTWSYQVTPSEVRQLLQKYGYNCGTVVSMEVTEYSDVGNVNRVTVTDKNGKTFTLSKDSVRMFQNISGVKYFSRRFRITPVYYGVEPEIPVINPPSSGKPVVVPGSPFEPEEEEKPVIQTGPLVIVDGNQAKDQKDSLFAITASGVVSLDKPISVLTQDGVQTVMPDDNATATVSATKPVKEADSTLVYAKQGELIGWILSGHGYGHNVGLSQWGAYAMAELDYDYKDILGFYYPGTKLR